MNPNSTLNHLEQVLIESMLQCKERTAAQFGKATKLAPKQADYNSAASEALTEIDLLNQETILQHLYKSFPGVAISVEERVDDPTEVQAAFYKNDATADYCVLLDPIDGTDCYARGLSPEYGIIAAITRRVNPLEAEYSRVICFYPSLDEFIIAREGELEARVDGHILPRRKEGIPRTHHPTYSCGENMTAKRLGLPDLSNVRPEFVATIQVIRHLVQGKISGFLDAHGHYNDRVAISWMAKQWGANVEYATGERFGPIPFGDLITPEGRKAPRDTRGLTIAGDRRDPCFQWYKENYSYPFYQRNP